MTNDDDLTTEVGDDQPDFGDDWRLPPIGERMTPLSAWLLVRQRIAGPSLSQWSDLFPERGEPVELVGMFALRDHAAAAAPVSYAWMEIPNADPDVDAAGVVGWISWQVTPDDEGRIEWRILCVGSAPDARAMFEPGKDPLFAALADPDGMRRLVIERAAARAGDVDAEGLVR